MNNKKFKNVFSKAFVVGMVAFTVGGLNVNAATVRENVDKEITDGSYIVGITRFNNVVITADRVYTAAQNDVFFKGLVGYVKPSIYQYQLGQWVKFDVDNNPSLASESEVAFLNSQDIYYINNEEKNISISYDANKAVGNTFIGVSSKGNVTLNYSNGALTVPATTTTIQVMKGAEVVETLDRTNTNDNGDFNYVSQGNKYFGSIAADNILTKSNATVNGETITIGGTINWVDGSVKNGVSLDGTVNSSKSGYRIGIKITAPDGTNLDNTNSIKVKIKNGDKTIESTFDAANAGQKGSFWFTPIVESGKTYEVEVIWTNNIPSQKFNIIVNATMAPMPAGTLSGESIIVKDKDNNDVTVITASADASKVTFSGSKMPWNGEATVKVKLNDLYANNASYTKAGVRTYTSEMVKDSDGYDVEQKTYNLGTANTFTDINVSKDKELIIPITFEDFVSKRKVVVSVKWDESYTQDFEVVLDENTPFNHPTATLSEVKTKGKDAAWEVSEDGSSVTVTHTEIDWDKDNGGTYVAGKLTVPVTSDTYETADMKNLTVKIDGVEQGTTDKDNKFTADNFVDAGTFDFKLYLTNPANNIKDETHKVEVVWAGKTIQTFNIIVNEVLLGVAPTIGSKAVFDTPYQYENVNGVYRVYRNATVDILDKDNKVTGRKEQDVIAFNYEKGANTVKTKFTNDSYAKGASKVVVADKEIEPDSNGFYDIPVSNTVTSVNVYWDSKNIQEFQIGLHSTNGKLENATNGTINGGTVNDNTSTSLSYRGDVIWDVNSSDNIVIEGEKAEEASGYRATVKISAPTRRKVEINGDTATITYPSINEDKEVDPIVTIDGGKYSNKKSTVNFDNADGTLTINPIVESAADVLTIKVQWYGEGSYEETYTVRFNSATLTDLGGILDVTNYIGTATYADGKHTIPVNLTRKTTGTNTVSKIEVDDASVETVNGKRTPKTITTPSIDGDKYSFNLEVSNEIRVLKVYVTWADNFKQTFVVDATETVIPTIIMKDGLEKSDENGIDYVVNATVGQNIGKLVSSNLPNTSSVKYTVDDPTIVTETNGSFVANTIGSTLVTLEMKDASSNDMVKPIKVRINVVNNALTANSTASLDGKKTIKVVSTVNGGTSGAKNVTAKLFALEGGVYSAITNDIPATINADGKYEIVLSDNNEDLPEDIIVKVVAQDSAYESNKTELSNLRNVEWINVGNKSAKQFTVSFDNEGNVQTVIVDAKIDDADSKKNGQISLPVAPEKETVITPNGNKKVYTFDGWYAVNDDNYNEDGTLKDTASKLADKAEIIENVTYKAEYTVETIEASNN